MDSRQIYGYGVSSKVYGPLKFGFRESPVSPFSNHFDCDILATLSDGKEHHSSTGSFSVKSPSNCNSPLETSSYYHGLNSNSSPSVDSTQDTVVRSDYRGVSMMRHALQELETTLMGDETTSGSPSLGLRSRSLSRDPQISQDSSQIASPSLGQRSRSWSRDPQVSQGGLIQSSSSTGGRRSEEEGQTEKRHKSMEGLLQHNTPSGNLKQLLIECARALSENRTDDFEKLVEEARKEISISGEPIQRLGAYMIEGLVARTQSSGNNIYRSLRCKEPLGPDLLSYMRILYEMCPYLKFGYMAANGAIAEACRNEDRIHIIDFQIAQGTQWLPLLQALAKRPGGAPFVRITGIDDPISKYARGTDLDAIGMRLKAFSEKHQIPIEFHAMPVFGSDVTREMLDVRPGEALAVNFALQLHHTPDESVDINNPRDNLLRMVKSLNPKVTTLIEQESNTNTTPFLTRFIEALEYYSAMFESIDATMPRDRKERINVEQHCLAKDIVNVIACEGKERVERHELFGKWKSRLTMAGFQQCPLSTYVNSVIRGLLRGYSEHYTLVEKDGAMLLGWKDRMLISASAWH